MKTQFSILLFFAAVIFTACSKSGGSGSSISGGTGVYVAGYIRTPSGQLPQTPVIWKNGTTHILQTGNNATGAEAKAVFVSGNDVYAAGNIALNGIINAVVWKNGVVQNLSDGSSDADAFSVFVSGNDVYVAGINAGTAVIWKNGTPLYTLANAYISSVYISGSDVYAVSGDGNYASVWKNGTLLYKTNRTAYSIYVSGSNVYAAGEHDIILSGNTSAVIWKNGVAQDISGGVYPSRAYSVYVSDGNVYVAGEGDNLSGKSIAKIWKNGIVQNLTNGYSSSADAYSVYVSGSDVYVAGDEGGNAILWKNGTAQVLPSGTGQAFGVFVVP